ncbi:hypothetical protein GQ472_01835 [archaeon]|nr:hypothetical protein [archaeon]
MQDTRDVPAKEKMVDLTDALERYTVEATREFLENLKKSDIMEMSFNHGEIIIVRVLEEDLGSTPDDMKYVVEVLYVIRSEGVTNESHKVGDRRWVRVYNLKRCGSIKT